MKEKNHRTFENFEQFWKTYHKFIKILEENKQKESKYIFEVIMSWDFPKLMTGSKEQIQENTKTNIYMYI